MRNKIAYVLMLLHILAGTGLLLSVFGFLSPPSLIWYACMGIGSGSSFVVGWSFGAINE